MQTDINDVKLYRRGLPVSLDVLDGYSFHIDSYLNRYSQRQHAAITRDKRRRVELSRIRKRCATTRWVMRSSAAERPRLSAVRSSRLLTTFGCPHLIRARTPRRTSKIAGPRPRSMKSPCIHG